MVAVIIALPELVPALILPLLSTVATVSSLLFQIIFESFGLTLAVNWNVSLAFKLILYWSRVMLFFTSGVALGVGLGDGVGVTPGVSDGVGDGLALGLGVGSSISSF